MHSSTVQRMRDACVRFPFAMLLIMSLLGAAGTAQAVDFAVSGSATINGQTGALPPDGTFSGSSYDPLTGAIGAGTFKFPATTVAYGSATLTYQLSQTGTSTAAVDDNGNVVFAPASMVLTLLNGTFPPFPPATFGDTCMFTPINVELAGTASGAGLDVGDLQFDIPPTTDECNGFSIQLNNYIPGSNNAIGLHVDGVFTAPDAIFIDGFEAD